MEHRGYFAVIPANVRYDRNLAPNAKLLYGEITALCNERGFCWARNSYFAKLYGVTERTVRNWISSLVYEEYIYVDYGNDEDDDTCSRKIYIYPMGMKMGNSLPRKKSSSKAENNFRGVGKDFPRGGEKIFPHNNTVNNTNNNHDDDDLAEVVKVYEGEISTVSSFLFEELAECKDTYGKEWVVQAIREAVKGGRQKCNIKYIRGILRRWKDCGLAKPWEKDKRPEQGQAVAGPHVTYRNGVRFENGSPVINTEEDARRWRELKDAETRQALEEIKAQEG